MLTIASQSNPGAKTVPREAGSDKSQSLYLAIIGTMKVC